MCTFTLCLCLTAYEQIGFWLINLSYSKTYRDLNATVETTSRVEIIFC